MDVDSNDNFYDDISSFIPQSGDYNLDDLEEILRSTDSQLDASLDLSTFVPHHNVHDFEMPTNVGEVQQQSQDNFNFNFSTFPSPATTNQSTCNMSARTSQRSSSTSSASMDELDQHFNPDEFINFLNDDEVKIDDLTRDTIMHLDMPQRNTPSPSGSCSSSGGSSTSGIQSDASSVSSMMSPAGASSEVMPGATTGQQHAGLIVPTVVATPTPAVAATVMPITLLPASTTSTAATAATTAILQPLNVLMPIKSVALPTVAVSNNIKTVTVASKPLAQPINLIPAVTNNNATIANAAKPTTTPANTNINAKPKTIYLSSNDFKALMQKMNGKKLANANNNTSELPKIIMKTPNGKVITANKMAQPVTTVAGQRFSPKIIKTQSGPLVIKQQPTKVCTTNAVPTPAKNATISNNTAPDLSIYKGIVDEKMYKKQQRMIKNRESASMSRLKKKQYVVSLETRINNLEKENYSLKGENKSLRSQLLAYAQTCQCKQGNISEFILNSLNINPKANVVGCEHVKIAPKPAGKSIKQRMTATSVRKNVAVLFAMAFMVTLNVGNFQTYLNKNSIENSIEIAEETPLSNGRHLLWVETESEYKEKIVRNKRETELAALNVPPLHFLRPNNRTGVHNGTAAAESSDGNKCAAVSYNQTENLRLASNLQKWIDGNGYLNLTSPKQIENGLNAPVAFKLTPDYFELKSFDLPLQAPGPGVKQKRKLYIERKQYEEGKQRKLDTNNVDNYNADDNSNDNDNGNSNGNRNSLEVFKPKISDEYLRLFKGIKRQDDTFYVLSFNMEHLLLPASVYNKSSRPKMSLMLPAGDPALNGDIVLMQIDCEVVNTTEVKLKSHMIPEKLRPTIKYSNFNMHTNAQPHDVANNDTGTPRNKSKDASMTPSPHKTNDTIKPKSTAPRVFTIFGPKTQAAAAANATIAADGILQSKPANGTMVKLNIAGNERVVALNMRNSTLFTKMRETVEGGEFAP